MKCSRFVKSFDNKNVLSMACHVVGQLVPWPGHLVICLFSSFIFLIFNLFLSFRKAVSFTEIPVCGKCQHNFVFVLI